MNVGTFEESKDKNTYIILWYGQELTKNMKIEWNHLMRRPEFAAACAVTVQVYITCGDSLLWPRMRALAW
jgi:hypothetical protein